MFGRLPRLLGWVVVSIAVLGAGLIASAQQTRLLTPGISVDSSISEENRAQVFTYQGDAGESIKLTLISGDGLALGVLVSDAAGEPLAQAADESGNGFLVLDNIDLDAEVTYYVTVFPLAVDDLPTQGDFSLSLALASGTAADVPETTTADTETTQPPEQDAAEIVQTVEATSIPTEAVEADVPTTQVADDGLTQGQFNAENGVQVSLTWNATVDMNLEVRDPVGGTVFWDSPDSISGGAFTTANANGACENFTDNSPTESVEWAPGELPTGTYEILVFYNEDCENNGAVPFTVTISVDGQELGPVQDTMLNGQVYISSFTIDADGDVALRDSGVEQVSLPASGSELVADAQTIAFGETITGAITNTQPFEAYTFEANAGDAITAAMSSTSGSLDAFLFLLDSNGQIIAENDDANPDTRNSEISAQVLETAGAYTLVATRYGQTIGGTVGEYDLIVDAVTAEEGTDGQTFNEVVLTQEVPDGLIEVYLTWNSTADLQLLVRDPLGDAVFDDNPTISSGAILELDGNVDCTLGIPESYIYWPQNQRLRPGTYEIDVWYQSDCGDNTPISPTLSVAIAGEIIFQETFNPTPQDHYITTFTINPDGAVTTGPGGIPLGSNDIDYTAELSSAATLTPNIPVTGTISDDNRFDIYTFEGTSGDTVNLRMEATAGNLDTLLFLLGPTGIELASNDDITPGENTNSLISEFTLPQDGQYVVLATHYGTIFGGTNGVYSLTLQN